MLTTHLANTVKIAREALGEDSFSVLTLGFDTPADTPERMASFARERGIELSGWHFASADVATVDAISRELGFVFRRTAAGFDHLAQTTVLDADGRVYAQVYGQSFDPPSLVEPLKQLVLGTPADARSFSGWLSGVRLFCTVYDPSSGRYRFDYSIFIALGVGLLSLGGVAVFVVRAWRGRRMPTPAA
jgi:protein SCO1/2